MSRYRGPKIRIVRRLGELPGLTAKTTTRETLPGQHKKVRGKQNNISSYSIRLQEKQKLRYNYGLTEKQLFSYVKEARRLKGSTGSVLIQLLEMRLDNIVYRLGIGNTIPASRQIVNHGHIYVNGKKVTIPSFQCSPNDVIEVRNRVTSKELAKQYLEKPSYNTVPQYLEFEKDNLKGKVKRVAENTETNLNINELLIVEYYSRR
ncbi:30S ribosomal protein S4 (chloroplast) [Aureococcus anophagefferens]|jgi:small subunit ribosomal protein S4|uniref:Small ribosomal subunit protein uS4c n=2 Tax=Aureococcus anophagefferens TaxID=44056 RepID=C6KIQ7_AURAN|nr:30S ribosomal protein S4 [Aureococcus anophagefferens]ACS36863.1 30S ribosomal protein S4 [Aureococcus anophagefferens]KAH8043030.1 30S ribosomal protein S4 [Aureococcus anophagefferens]KAH8043129.1 30S ribosomal protein S4 [Aureococcus anophagefferens]KAH8043332.1 30S ribosomal protein S4 [Aureococcus anophagefferens]|tara:strand:+ start:1062 stop:1676 length:615 start_codon:yes stop_codon:yes gene_type:complete